MNSLEIYIDDNDFIIDCVYQESIDEYLKEKIVLPQDKLQEIFKTYIKKYPNYIEKIGEKYIVYSFNDIDINDMDKILKESLEYKKELLKNLNVKQNNNDPLNPISVSSQNFYQSSKRILHRKNKFNKTSVVASALVLVSLTTFSISKKLDDIKQRKTSIEYTDSFNDFKENNYNSIELNYEMTMNTLPPIEPVETPIPTSFIEPTVSPTFEPISVTPTPTPTVTPDFIEEDVTEINKNNIEQSKDIEEILIKEIEPDYILSLDTIDQTDSEKFHITESYYRDFITNIANEYGLSGDFMLAVGCHENLIHKETVSTGGGLGLYQIQVEGSWNWLGKTVSGYNFKTEKWDKITINIDEETGNYNVSDLEINTRVACMIMQQALINQNYDIAKGTTEYNYGNNNINIVINTWCESSQISNEERNNPQNLDWLDYRTIIKGGDSNYLENVFKYIPNDKVLIFTKPNYETVIVKFNNLNFNNTIKQ